MVVQHALYIILYLYHPTIADNESPSPINHSAKPDYEFQTLIKCNQKLTQSLLNSPLSITSALLARGLISDETEQEVHANSIPYRKVAVLVSTIRNKIKVNPEQFHDVVSVLREHTWTKDIAGVLQSVCLIMCSEQSCPQTPPLISTKKAFLVFAHLPTCHAMKFGTVNQIAKCIIEPGNMLTFSYKRVTLSSVLQLIGSLKFQTGWCANTRNVTVL